MSSTLPDIIALLDGEYICLRKDKETKAQAVRVLDIFVIGPLMFWGGLKAMEEDRFWGNALIAFGVSTSIYNARNYLAVSRAIASSSSAASSSS